MNKTPLRHMTLHADALADEFDAILGLRTSHSGIVQAGGPSFTMNAANWPGTLSMKVDATTDLIPDSGVFTFATWVRIAGSDTAAQWLWSLSDGGTQRLAIRRTTTGQVQVYARDSGATALINNIASSANALVAATGPVCLMVAASRAGNWVRAYVGDTSIINTTWTATSADIGFSTAERAAIGGDWFASSAFTGDLGNFVFDSQSALDFSSEAIRRLFIDAAGDPVSLGADGSTPFGYQPDVYMGNDDDYSDWDGGAINLGTLKGGHATTWTKQGSGSIVAPVFF